MAASIAALSWAEVAGARGAVDLLDVRGHLPKEPAKLREAARELHTFVTRAQAEAARLGRPYGIALRVM